MRPVLIAPPDAPMEPGTDRKLVRWGVAAAGGGTLLALSTLVVEMEYVGIVALVVALAAGAVTVVLGRRLAQVNQQVAQLGERVGELTSGPDAAPVDDAASAMPAAGAAAEPASAAAGDQPTLDLDHRGAGEHLTDPATGLFSEGYFRVALDARLSAARRHLRPVAVVLLDVVDGLADGLPRPTTPTAVAEGISETVRDADTACRMKDGRFGLVLEDTPENGAIWTIERVRRHLADRHPGQTLWAGVACYPAHAFDAEEILRQAEVALGAAREWRQDRIEVATAS